MFWRKFLLEIPGGAVTLSLQGLGVLEEVLTRDTWQTWAPPPYAAAADKFDTPPPPINFDRRADCQVFA